MTTRRHDLKSWLLVAALVVASAALVWGGAQHPAAQKALESSNPAKDAGAERSQSATGHGDYTAVAGDVVRTLFFTGELKAESSINISAPRIRSSFSSMITYLAPEGEQINKGERLVEFDSSTLLSQKSEIERRVAEAKLQI
jgi:multidrug efflux pump subunit AcrA (membrane-fusion protein)